MLLHPYIFLTGKASINALKITWLWPERLVTLLTPRERRWRHFFLVSFSSDFMDSIETMGCPGHPSSIQDSRHPKIRGCNPGCFLPGSRNLPICTVAVTCAVTNVARSGVSSHSMMAFGLQFTQRLYDPGCHFPGCRNLLSCTVAVANIIMLSDPGCPFGLQFTQRLNDPGYYFPGCRYLLSCTVAVANIIMMSDPGCPFGLQLTQM